METYNITTETHYTTTEFYYILTESGKKIKLCPTSLWDFPSCHPDYGSPNFRGRIPAQIYFNYFHYFTNPNDTILDLFCGAGTGLDAGYDFNRRVIGFDLRPIRRDITQYDLLQDKNPFPKNYLNHIFLDPPYWNMMKGKYTSLKNDLSMLSLEKYLHAIELIIKKFKPSLKRNGTVGIIISNKKQTGELIDLEEEINQIFKKYFKLTHKVSIPYQNTQDQSCERLKRWIDRKFLLIGHRTLFVFKNS